MDNGWTGGQYSLFRALLGAYLLAYYSRLAPWGAGMFSSAAPPSPATSWSGWFPNVLALHDAPALTHALLVLGTLAAALLALGAFDRLAAIVLCYLGACMVARDPLLANPGLPPLGALLLAHAAIPGAPYGSWKARGRADPRGRFAVPRRLFLAAWIAVALAYAYAGLTRLGDVPVWAGPGPWLLFALLAPFRRLRPWLWLGMAGLLAARSPFDGADWTLALLLVHLFLFDPAWIGPRGERTERLFYDGHCALCHGMVRFVLAEDRSGTALDFAPLQGPGLPAAVGAAAAASLPDSLVLLTADRRVLVRSSAVAHALARLGGLWRVLGGALAATPRPLRDAGYAAIARVRRRVFGTRDAVCPIISPDLRRRFDLERP